MILVDTSVWIDHLQHNNETLVRLLNDGQVVGHPFVIGELALGNLSNRGAIIGALQDLPQATVATHDEVLVFIEQNTLCGLGVGYIDAHLLAAARLSAGTALWTRDKRLLAASARLGLAADVACL